MEENKFTDKQNETFKGLFGALMDKGKFQVEVRAFALIDFDDENFTKMFTDSNCNITGTDEEIDKVNQRAKYLELL